MVNELLDELFDDRIDDPSLGAVFKTSRNIVIVGLCVILFLLTLQIFSIVDQFKLGTGRRFLEPLRMLNGTGILVASMTTVPLQPLSPSHTPT